MPERTHLRRASEDDYRAFYGREPPPDFVGFCAVRDARIVAFAFVALDQQGRAWVGIDRAREVPPLMLHRKIAAMMTALREEGIEAVYASCDERIPRAAEWLARLGFRIDPAIPEVYMPQVDKTIPVWVRMLR